MTINALYMNFYGDVPHGPYTSAEEAQSRANINLQHPPSEVAVPYVPRDMLVRSLASLRLNAIKALAEAIAERDHGLEWAEIEDPSIHDDLLEAAEEELDLCIDACKGFTP